MVASEERSRCLAGSQTSDWLLRSGKPRRRCTLAAAGRAAGRQGKGTSMVLLALTTFPKTKMVPIEIHAADLIGTNPTPKRESAGRTSSLQTVRAIGFSLLRGTISFAGIILILATSAM